MGKIEEKSEKEDLGKSEKWAWEEKMAKKTNQEKEEKEKEFWWTRWWQVIYTFV